MLPPRPTLDPAGYYQRLGVNPEAPRTAIVAAFRAKARVLHPDVPKTGNAAAFVAIRQAYDVLSDTDRRAAYDRSARQARADPKVVVLRRSAYAPPAPPGRQPLPFEIPVVVWAGLGAFLCLCVYQVVAHLMALPSPPHELIRPNAATVAPLSPSAHEAILYSPTPTRLAGTPNFYVIPSASPAVLWQLDTDRKVLVPLGQLPPFSSVEAVRLIRQIGMFEVLVNEHGNGFISVDHLTQGNATAARQAYCGYNAGPTPYDGERLEQHATGDKTLKVDNRSVQPAVLKLRSQGGTVAVSVFLGPGGHAELNGLPDGIYHPEFAIGELWSRACNAFAAGMQARRMQEPLDLDGGAHLVLAPDAGEPAADDISDQAFEQK